MQPANVFLKGTHLQLSRHLLHEKKKEHQLPVHWRVAFTSGYNAENINTLMTQEAQEGSALTRGLNPGLWRGERGGAGNAPSGKNAMAGMNHVRPLVARCSLALAFKPRAQVTPPDGVSGPAAALCRPAHADAYGRHP